MMYLLIMKIGISINEIVRDLWTKVKSVHEKYYDSKIEGELTEKNVLEKLNLDEDSLLDFLLFIHLSYSSS